MAGEKTEKATPKKAKEAREKGQVAGHPPTHGDGGFTRAAR